jgi:hypothetical protein
MPLRPLLGEQIKRLTYTLAAVKGWSRKRTMDYVGERTCFSVDMIYRWQQGRSSPAPDTIETLAQIGKDEANLSREWAESLLRSSKHPEAVEIVNRLWGPKETRSISCNLPARPHLIGRRTEIARLLELLSPNHAASLITVDGIGGVGKTALVLEVAHRCWKASTGEEPNSKVPLFEAIIFISAKQQYLTSDGVLPSNEAKRTLHAISREIASTLNHFEITSATRQDQLSRVREALARQRTLLLVDNLETMEDKQEIISFLYELPRSVKVVITTRERVLSFSPIRLEQLPQEEGLNLIEKESHEKEANLNRQQALNLYQRIGGIPAALIYAIGQIASGYSMETVLKRIPKAGGDIARFCFEESVNALRGQPAHHLLMTMSMFPKSPLRMAIAHAAGIAADQIILEESLAQLRKLSLIRQHEARYTMLPLTREYALVELTAHPEFEREARKQWVDWYLDFVKEYGGDDWTEWHIQFDHIEEEWENLLTVFDWCVAHEQYDVMRSFWHESGVLNFSDIYGYWDDRLMWLQWLIQAAERRADWPTLVGAITRRGFTLILIDQLEEANTCLQRAWDIHEYAVPRAQVFLAQTIALLRIYQRQYTDAAYWLDQTRILLQTIEWDELESTRRWITTQHYQALMYYRQQDYSQAQAAFQEELEHAQPIGWQRAIIRAQGYLANLAIIQDRLAEAESLLRIGLLAADRNKDKRTVAYYRGFFVGLYQKRADIDEACRWARAALDSFGLLGMRADMEEMHKLLEELQG